MATKTAANKCNYCQRPTTNADKWCRVCDGPGGGQSSEAAASVTKAAEAEHAENVAINAAASSLSSGAGTETSSELVEELATAVQGLAKEQDPERIPDHVTRAARSEDAVLSRHPDPLGAALVEASWRDPSVDPQRQAISSWLASNLDTADLNDVHDGLTQLNPGHPQMCDVAVARLAHINNPSQGTATALVKCLRACSQASAGSLDTASEVTQ